MPLRFLLLLLAFPAFVSAQSNYPQNLFRNPLSIPIQLAGNFGECRPNHFHSGIDIKTEGKENLPIYAAAAGYVSRISLKPGGFGHCLYITHPEGYTTVYAHLNDFVKPLQDFVRAAQYRTENWEMDTTLPASFFPVTKGQQIAFSGNTGGSTAPHLHFEIRNTETEHPLNPQLFGLNAADSRAPVLRNLYVFNLDYSRYQAAPQKVALQKFGNGYRPAGGDTLTIAASRVGIGIDGDDYANGSENTLAPKQTGLSVSGTPICTITLDDIGYDATRYLHAYADYSTKQKGGPWVQLMFRMPGNELHHIYEAKQDGIFEIGTQPIAVEGYWEDAAGHKSSYAFWLKSSGKSQPACIPTWKAGEPLRYESANLRLRSDAALLYDAVCEGVQGKPASGLSAAYTVGRVDIPLHTSLTVWMKPNRPVPFHLRSKLALLRSDGQKEVGNAALPDSEGWYRAKAMAFGTYRLVYDTTAPVITPAGSDAQKLRFRIADKTTGVASVRAEVDGKWILLEQHGDTWTHVFDGRIGKGSHPLAITALDELGNRTVYRTKISR